MLFMMRHGVLTAEEIGRAERELGLTASDTATLAR
jgi:hypothetical protein